MAQWLEINMDLKLIDWKILYDKFDSRNGFQTIAFGFDIYEDCELLEQVSKALDFDLSFIKSPEGRAFEKNVVTIEEFVALFQKLLKRFDDRPYYYMQINYRYISLDYFAKKKFNTDLQILMDFFEYHSMLGATVAWFEFG